MKKSTLCFRYIVLMCLLLISSMNTYAQRIYASTETTGASGLLCLNCTVTNPANAADANIETFSILNVTVGVASETYQTLVFPGSSKVPANTPVTVKIGSGNTLLSLTALGGVLLQAYNGNTAIGQPVAASTLVSALSNNNQVEVSISPTAAYDRIRVTLDGGLAGALGSLYLYEAFYNGTAAGACNSAIDELHGISAGLLNLGVAVGGVVNPQNAIDGNINTYATLNASIGAVGAQAQETVIYEAPSVKGDSIRLTIAIPQALIDAGVFTNISVTTYNGNSGPGETYTLSSAILNVRLLDLTNNIRKVTITYAPVNIFDRVQLTLGGGIANVLSTLNFYEAQKLIPRPVIKFNNVVTTNASICSGSTAALTATAVPNTTFLWYATATSTTPIFTGAAFTTPALTATTTYYVAAMRTGCTDQSERSPVTVTVNNIPANPVVANAAVAVCPGSPATFTAKAVTGVTVNWYTTATGGAPIATGNTFTTGALTQTTNYYAEAVAGGTCVSPGRTQVTATVSALPASPGITTPNVTICDGDVAVFSIAVPAAGVTYNWYSTATGGTPLFTGINFTSPALHASTSYYAEAINATGCPSAVRTQATVTVTPKPADPVFAANNLTIAAGQTATINVSNAQTGITYNWYTSATAATAIFTGTTFTTPALFTSTTYYVSAVNATGCQSADRTAITINVTVDNNTPCSFANTQTSMVNGLCVGCSVANQGLAVDADTTTYSTITAPAGLVGGYAQQQLNFQQPGFAGDTIKIEVGTAANLLSAAVAGNVQVILYNGATQVQSYALNNALVKVRLLASSNRYAVYVPASGNYTSAVIRVNSGVASVLTTLQVYYAVQIYPKPVFNPANAEICKGSTAVLNITSPTNGTFQWYTAPTGGTLAFTGTSFTTPALNANTSYYIAYTRGTCVSTVRYPVQVLVDSPPAAPVVAPSSAAIFSGQTATFTATVPNNVTVNWYATPTGGTSVYTGTTFTTPALTTNTTYYAESSLGSCVSTTRTPAPVTVTALVVPNVTVTPPIQSVNPGTTATLVASSTTPGTTFNWYTTPTGGTSIFTGPTFTTPPVFTGTTYYAEAVVTASGTKSATRASGVVNVNATTTNPTLCDAAIDQSSSISGLACVLCAVNNPTGSVDNDRNTFSQLDVPVGLVGAYAEQTLRFASTGLAGDTVVIELGTPGAIASVGVLSGISLATYNGTTYNNDRFNINTSLISVTLVSGTSRFRYAFVATHDFDRVEIRLNSAAAGVLSALSIYDATEEVAAPVIATASVSTCQGSQATLTATVPADVTVKWYTTPTGGTPVFTGAVFNTPALNATTTYYAEASRTADGCTQAVRTPATVTVTPIPAPPVVTAPTQTVCSGSPATFTAQPVAGVTYSWYTAAAGGTPVFTGNPYTTGPLSTSATYYVEANGAGTCGSPTRTMVTANVTATPLVPTVAQTPVQTCSGSSAVLTASSSQPGVTFNWYTAATGGAPVFTGAQYTTPALTANTNYYVEAASGSCVSPTRAAATVNVNPTPVNPVATTNPANGQVASGQTATITATSTTTGAAFNWYTSATGGTPVFTGPTFTTPVLTSNTTYYVEADLAATGCASPSRTAVTITVNPLVTTTCDFASSQTTSINGGGICLLCSVTNANNAVDADTTTFSQLNLPLAALNSYVAQTLNFADAGIVGDTVSIRIRVPASLLSAGILDHIQVASYNAGVYNGDRINASNGLITVELLPGNLDAIIKFEPKAAYDAVEVRLDNTGLALLSSLDIFYATKQVEQPALSATTENICSGTKAVFTVSNARTGVTYKWYTAAVGGTLLFTGTTFTTPDLSATTTYYVESSRTATGCTNPNRVAATANVTPSPVTPILAQNNLQICAGDNVTLSVTNAGTGIVQWYDAATGGNLLFTGANYQVSPVADATYYATIVNGSCSSATRVVATVHVNQRPAQAGVQSANITVCIGSPATITVLSPEAGVTYSYYAAATGGTALATGSTFTTPAISQNTTYYIEASNTASGCINSGGRTQVNVTVSNQVNNPTLSATQTSVCSGGSVTLSVENPVAGLSYNWYTAATAGTLVFTGTTFTTNNLIANVDYFVEADNSTGCTSPGRTETDITVIPVPTAPQVQSASGSLSVCSGSSATLSIVNPAAGNVYRWYDAATGGTLLFTGTQFNTPPLTATTTYYVEAANAGNCNPSARTAVTITINALPADPTLVSNNVLVCLGNSATLSVSSPQAGVTYTWYDSPAETNLLFTGPTYITGPITATTDFYVSAANSSGCSSNNSAQAQVSVQPAPGAPVVANGSTVQSCTGSQVTLTIANPDPTFTYAWYTTATGGTAVATGTSFTTPVLTANTTYYAEAANSTGCVSSTRTPVDIDVNALPAAPTVTAQGGSSSPTVCAGSSATLTATSTTANVTFNWYTVATGGTPVFTGATYTTPPINATTTYYVEAVSNTGGCASTTRTSIQITTNAPPATPVPTATAVNACVGSPAVLSVSNPLAGITYNWYDSATKANLLFTGPTYTTGPITASVTYYVDAENGSCTSPSVASVQVTAVAAPAAPTVSNGSTVQSCAGAQVTLTIANPDATLTYNWYTTASGGTAVATGTSFTTAALTTNTTYYAEASNSTGCASPTRTRVDINVNALPTAPTVTAQGGSSSPTVCAGSSATLTATSTTANVTFNWYTVATGGTAVFTGATYTTPAINATTTYYVEAVSNTGGCASTTRTAVQVTTTTPPATPVPTATAVNACVGSPAILSVSNPLAGITYNWYDSATKANLLFTGPTYTTGPITASATYYVDAENGSCTSPSVASVQVTAVAAPGAPLVSNGTALTTCDGTQVTLSINSPQSGFTYNWYNTATGGTPVATGTNFTTPVLTANTTYYAEAVNSNSCVSATRTAVSITISPAPAAPQVSAAGTSICPGISATLSATSDANTTINWYTTATGGTLAATGTSFTTPALNANTTYYAEAVNAGGCTSATRTASTVTILQQLASPVVSVSGTTANTVSFEWSAVSGATGYQVSFDNGATFANPALGASALSETVVNLLPGQSVTIIVRATGATICQLSANSAPVTGTTLNPLGDGIFVPNAFTPNGDGKNDVEYVYGTTISSLSFMCITNGASSYFHQPTSPPDGMEPIKEPSNR